MAPKMLTFATNPALTIRNLSAASSSFCPSSHHVVSLPSQSNIKPSNLSVYSMSSASSSPSPSTMTASSETTATSTEPLVVMVNGLPGKMAHATAEEVNRRGLTLASEVMTGPNMSIDKLNIQDIEVQLQEPNLHEETLKKMRENHSRLIIVDYTHPSCANSNVQLYCKYKIPFVIGTTGGDIDIMKQCINQTSDVYAVIAPNMGKQIVAFQTMMSKMAQEYSSVFNGYTLSVKESHQSTKADTSGTAKSVVQSFQNMGINEFHESDIIKVRNENDSIKEMKVPQEFVNEGHAFHTYRLQSDDGSVAFEFQHNVCGRNIYASGTVDAVLFLDQQIQNNNSNNNNNNNNNNSQRIFSMIDILQSGKMS